MRIKTAFKTCLGLLLATGLALWLIPGSAAGAETPDHTINEVGTVTFTTSTPSDTLACPSGFHENNGKCELGNYNLRLTLSSCSGPYEVILRKNDDRVSTSGNQITVTADGREDVGDIEIGYGLTGTRTLTIHTRGAQDTVYNNFPCYLQADETVTVRVREVTRRGMTPLVDKYSPDEEVFAQNPNIPRPTSGCQMVVSHGGDGVSSVRKSYSTTDCMTPEEVEIYEGHTGTDLDDLPACTDETTTGQCVATN